MLEKRNGRAGDSPSRVASAAKSRRCGQDLCPIRRASGSLEDRSGVGRTFLRRQVCAREVLPRELVRTVCFGWTFGLNAFRRNGRLGTHSAHPSDHGSTSYCTVCKISLGFGCFREWIVNYQYNDFTIHLAQLILHDSVHGNYCCLSPYIASWPACFADSSPTIWPYAICAAPVAVSYARCPVLRACSMLSSTFECVVTFAKPSSTAQVLVSTV